MTKKIEIRPRGKVVGSVRAPGSKSLTNRALIAAALAEGESRLLGALRSDDTLHMVGGLRGLGVEIVEKGNDFIVHGRGRKLLRTREPLYCGNSGTTLRFLTSVAALGQGRIMLDGDRRMRERPVQDLLDALGGLGVNASSLHANGCPPLVVEAGGIAGGKTTLSGRLSSQYLSSLLLASPLALSPVEIEIRGEQVSKPYVDMTVALMLAFGAAVEREGYRRYAVPAPRTYTPRVYAVEADASNASYFFAAAAVTGGRVRVANLPADSVQGDASFVDVLERMGCRVIRSAEGVEVEGGPLRGIDVDLNSMPDMAQTLAVVALFAEGATSIRNVANLRVKETDRLAAMARELRKLGAEVEEEEAGLFIRPGAHKGAEIETYNDHRMAMSFAVAGLRIPGVLIRNPDCVSKTFPDFFERFDRLREGE